VDDQTLHLDSELVPNSTDVQTAVDADGLLEFLTHPRAGFCAHYSSAMAVMVRTHGLPARIGSGIEPVRVRDRTAISPGG
jgi:transglutaminase-like putative cysteine protease